MDRRMLWWAPLVFSPRRSSPRPSRRGRWRASGICSSARRAPSPTRSRGSGRDCATSGTSEGQTIHIEYRYADRPERLPELAAELVGLKVDVILAPGTAVTRAVQRTTTTIPVVSTSGTPVESGFATSLARPGGNITGLSLDIGCQMGGKRLEILKAAFPRIARYAVIWNPTNTATARCLPEEAAMAAESSASRERCSR